MFQVGDHVWADFDGSGYVLAHVVAGAHQNAAGETKYGVQAPDGKRQPLTHREESDVDASGTGGTFKQIG